jgi:K+-sensing histidine kinase KdpD
VAPDLPASIVTDGQRLQQILRNLLSNAVKFTDSGSVTLSIFAAPPSTDFDIPALAAARQVVAFAVSDTGIGISDEKLAIIFEPFQQADGTTTRKYGGTGLGLSISREFAALLGGTIVVSSMPGEGSTFTLYSRTRWCRSDPIRRAADAVDTGRSAAGAAATCRCWTAADQPAAGRRRPRSARRAASSTAPPC